MCYFKAAGVVKGAVQTVCDTVDLKYVKEKKYCMKTFHADK